jgi:hypothetical protein
VFYNELENIFDQLTLAQIAQLQGLLQIMDANPQIPLHTIVDFMKTVPRSIYEFIRTYCFPHLRMLRPATELEEPSAKRRKKN